MCRIYTTFYGTFYLSFIYLSTDHASYCSRHIIRQNNINNIHFFTALCNHNIHLLFLRYSAFAFKLLSIRYLSTARLFDLSLNTLLFHSSYAFFHVKYFHNLRGNLYVEQVPSNLCMGYLFCLSFIHRLSCRWMPFKLAISIHFVKMFLAHLVVAINRIITISAFAFNRNYWMRHIFTSQC